MSIHADLIEVKSWAAAIAAVRSGIPAVRAELSGLSSALSGPKRDEIVPWKERRLESYARRCMPLSSSDDQFGAQLLSAVTLTGICVAWGLVEFLKTRLIIFNYFAIVALVFAQRAPEQGA